jgi:hypothetical protein
MLCRPLLAEDSDVQAKLKALKAAHEAGILTDEEYAGKKAELEAQLQPAMPPLDEATQQKLKALEVAHQAGILSDEEYARKKAELLGQSSGTDATLYRDPKGSFQFQHPPDWKVQTLPQGQGIALMRGQAALNVMPLPDGVNPQQVLEHVVGEIRGQWQNYRELRRDQRKVGGIVSPLVEFTGVNPQGTPAHSQITVFVSGVKGYVFILAAPENEPENNFAAIQPAWEALLNSFKLSGTTTSEKKGKTFRHPIGFTFWHPENWTVQETDAGLQLTPSDTKSNQQGPTEVYLITAEPAQGISRPDDPQVIQYLESQLMTILPFLRRTGEVESVKAGGELGALITWEGQNPTGMKISAHVYVTVLKGYAAALAGLGQKSNIEARKSTLREIFSTFGFGEGEKDPRLVGTWRYEKIYISGTFSTTTVRYMALRADGTLTSGSRFLASMSHQNQYGDSTGSSTADTGQDPGERGRWYSGEDRLYLMWDDGSYSEYGYYIEGAPGSRSMLLKTKDDEKELWEEVR